MKLNAMVLGDTERVWASGKGKTRTLSVVEWGTAATLTKSIEVELVNADTVPAGELLRKEVELEVLELVPINFGKAGGCKAKLLLPTGDPKAPVQPKK